MRNFRLYIIALMLALALFSAWAGILYAGGRYALALPVASVAAGAGVALGMRIKRLIGIMADYMAGLEMEDSSMRIEGDRFDSDIREMAESMNRIAETYFRNRRDLETRKLYYDRILRVMTHEMRNSIAPVASLSADIAEHPEAYSAEDLHEAIGIIRDSSAGINRFLDSYRTLTHLPVPEKVVLEGAPFFRQLYASCDVFRRNLSLPEGTLSFRLAEGIRFEADPALLSQALVNIVKNSLESVAECGSTSPSVEMKVTRSGEGIAIIIDDNGGGLPPSMAADPFQPFVTTKEGGSGIGLFLTRQLIRLHGGDIRIADHPGRGLTVSIGI